MQNIHILLIEKIISKENLPREPAQQGKEECVSEGWSCSQYQHMTGNLENWIRMSAKVTDWVSVGIP